MAEDTQDPAIPPPQIPDKTFSITDFGAIADGKTMNTAAIANTIKQCSAAGGGTVLIPAGKFLTAAFSLASNINLHLDDKATLLFSDNPADWSTAGRTGNCLETDSAHDISITGKGTIDGQGQSWWKAFRAAQDDSDSTAKIVRRPYLVVFRDCSRLLIEDVTLTNSPSFHLVPGTCQNVVIRNLHIQAPANAPNTDGIDPSGWNFLITHCVFDTGDDCIAIKPTHQIDPKRPSCENFLISNCTFLHGHGMSIGGQSNGGLNNLTVRDCTFQDTDAGIRMKAGRGYGGLVENATYENFTMKNVKVPIFITSYYPRIPTDPDKDPSQPVTKTTPIWRNIHIKNVTIDNCPVAGRILGLPEMSISDITLDNVKISAARGMQIVHANNIKFINSTITTASGAALLIQSSKVDGIDPATGH